MDEALFALITGNAGVSALVAGRVFWGVAVQGQGLPALVLTVTSGADAPQLEGTDGLWRYGVQIDCYGINRPAARSLSRAVTQALNGHSDAGFNGIFLGATREGFEDAAVDRPSRVILDFNIIWRG